MTAELAPEKKPLTPYQVKLEQAIQELKRTLPVRREEFDGKEHFQVLHVDDLKDKYVYWLFGERIVIRKKTLMFSDKDAHRSRMMLCRPYIRAPGSNTQTIAQMALIGGNTKGFAAAARGKLWACLNKTALRLAVMRRGSMLEDYNKARKYLLMNEEVLRGLPFSVVVACYYLGEDGRGCPPPALLRETIGGAAWRWLVQLKNPAKILINRGRTYYAGLRACGQFGFTRPNTVQLIMKFCHALSPEVLETRILRFRTVFGYLEGYRKRDRPIEHVARQVDHLMDLVAAGYARDLDHNQQRSYRVIFRIATDRERVAREQRPRFFMGPRAEIKDWSARLTLPEHPMYEFRELVTAAELEAEGVEMGHCVAGYATGASNGEYSIVSIKNKKVKTDRATAEVTPTLGGGFYLEQIRSFDNADPTETLRRAFVKILKQLSSQKPKERALD